MNRIATTALLLALTAGCTQTGGEGVLSFIGEDGLIDIWADFAVGTKVTVNVFDANASDSEADSTVVVSGATVEDPELATVLGVAENTVKLDVLTAGTSRLTVTSNVGDDWIEITSQEPVVVLDKPRSGEAYAPLVVIVGGEAPVPYSLKAESGSHLLGGGLGGFELEGEVAGELTPVMNDSSVIVAFSAGGEGTITHPNAEAGRAVKAVEQSELDSITLGAQRFSGESSEVDGATLTTDEVIMLTPSGSLADGTEVLGLDTLLTVATNDDTVCTVSEENFFGTEVWLVSLEAAGQCEVTATLGEHSDKVSFTVTE